MGYLEAHSIENPHFYWTRSGTNYSLTTSISLSNRILKAIGSTPFDNDGMATKDRLIIQDGVLQGYILSAYSARKLDMKPTGNAGGVHNLIIDPGTDDLNAMVQAMGRGLLVTELIGFGVNQVTGDYSRGAAGFWVEKAKFNILLKKSPLPATWLKCSGKLWQPARI